MQKRMFAALLALLLLVAAVPAYASNNGGNGQGGRNSQGGNSQGQNGQGQNGQGQNGNGQGGGRQRPVEPEEPPVETEPEEPPVETEPEEPPVETEPVVEPQPVVVNVTVNFYVDVVNENNLTNTITITATQDETITLTNAVLDQFQPASGYEGGRQQKGPHKVQKGKNVIDVVYPAIPAPDCDLTIRYYKDRVYGKPIAETCIVGKPGSIWTVKDGYAEGNLDWCRPDGYDRGRVETKPFELKHGKNYIDVVYCKLPAPKLANLKIYYFADSVETGKLLGYTYLQVPVGDQITLLPGFADMCLDKYKPHGYSSGVQQPKVPYHVKPGDNAIYVVYTKQAKPANLTVVYYKDSFATKPLGSSKVAASVGDSVILDAFSLNKFKPEGYLSGIQYGDIPYIVKAGENIINVLYCKKQPDKCAELTIVYYKDCVDSKHIVGKSSLVVNVGSQIMLLNGPGEGSLDKFKPAGYFSGVQQGCVPYVVKAGKNTIDVLYIKEQKDLCHLTIVYYKDSLKTHPIGQANITVKPGAEWKVLAGIAEGCLDMFRPAGYASGVQQGKIPFVPSKHGNVICVLYTKDHGHFTHGSYVVNYIDKATGEAIAPQLVQPKAIPGEYILKPVHVKGYIALKDCEVIEVVAKQTTVVNFYYTVKKAPKVSPDSISPETGDASSIIAYGLSSLGSLAAIIAYKKRKSSN
ncbi:MAG: hypothetical protein FWG30_04340 [Eubacteriaceae bacterium]|nr:hypothetical protein [Eubacteriaceae bacterium]